MTFLSSSFLFYALIGGFSDFNLIDNRQNSVYFSPNQLKIDVFLYVLYSKLAKCQQCMHSLDVVHEKTALI